MSIRNAANAIIIHENKVLLNQCYMLEFGDYFTLPVAHRSRRLSAKQRLGERGGRTGDRPAAGLHPGAF